MISFPCPHCAKPLRLKDEFAGKKGKCPGCGQGVTVPAAPDKRTAVPVHGQSSSTSPFPREVRDGGSGKLAKATPPQADSEAATIPPESAARAARGAPSSANETVAAEGAPKAAVPRTELTDFLAPPQAPDEIGRLGSYRILKVLGAGGMGVVFHAEDPGLLRPVALKAMLPALAASASARQRFLREARAAAAVKHDHVVTIYQVAEDRGVPFLAMEFLHGEALDARIKGKRQLPPAEVLRIGRETAEGLAAAHERGLIHRDIKPANIWLEAPRDRVKILDFGLAKSGDDEAHLTVEGAIVGTAAYMAPEQAVGKPLDGRCDLFSLGVLLYRLSTGKQPFKGSDAISTLMSVATDQPPAPSEMVPEVPPKLSELVMRLLAKEPDGRPPSAQAVVEAIRAIEEDRTEVVAAPGARPVAPAGRATDRRGPPRRGPWLALSAGAAVLGVALGTAAFFLLGPSLASHAAPKATPAQSGPDGQPQPPPVLLCPADSLRREDIPADALARAGGGDPAKAPAELVAVLGEKATCLAISPDGKWLATGTSAPGAPVVLWELATGSHRFSFETTKRDANGLYRVLNVAFSSDGKLLASSSSAGGGVKLWDVDAGKALPCNARAVSNGFIPIAFRPERHALAVATDDGVVRLYDTSTWGEQTFVCRTARMRALAFSPDGTVLAAAGIPADGPDGCAVTLWDVETRAEQKTSIKQTFATLGLAFSPDGKMLAMVRNTIKAESNIFCYVREADQEMAKKVVTGARVDGVVINGNGLAAVPGYRESKIRIIDFTTDSVTRTLDVGPGVGSTIAVAFTPDGRHLVTVNGDGSVYVLRLAPPPQAAR